MKWPGIFPVHDTKYQNKLIEMLIKYAQYWDAQKDLDLLKFNLVSLSPVKLSLKLLLLSNESNFNKVLNIWRIHCGFPLEVFLVNMLLQIYR